MSGLRSILQFKPEIDERIGAILEKKHAELLPIHAWGSDAIGRLREFVVSGKTIRGSLVVYTYTRFYPHATDPVFDAAVGMEFLHAGLLIHDDIMDRDETRRGKASMHIQYRQIESADEHFGVSMAINVADLCFFLAFERLPPAIVANVAKELQYVAVGQMQDVANSVTTEHTKDELMNLYRYKTARYTFSLPMAVGALLAGASAPTVSRLDALGERLGLLFQLRDDELNSDGDSAVTGKPTGSDAANAKQTIRSYLSAGELHELKAAIQKEASDLISHIPYSPTHKSELTELMHFVSTRNK